MKTIAGWGGLFDHIGIFLTGTLVAAKFYKGKVQMASLRGMRAVVAVITTGFIFGLNASYAQISQTQAEGVSSLRSVPSDQVSSLPGTWYSLQYSNLPPMPCFPPLLRDLDLAVYDLGQRRFVVDDLSVDYAALAAERAELDKAFRAAETALGLSSPLGLDDLGAGNASGGSSLDSVQIFTNGLWLDITNVLNGYANLILHGTTNDVQYEILSKQNLTDTNWQSEGIFIGADNQDWTPYSVPVLNRTNLFLWARSWIDSDGSGLPDWWQLKYFGHTGVDPYADPDGDGWNNLQEFQNGTDPTQFNTPPPPKNVTARFDSTGTNLVIAWQSGGGPVTYYGIESSWVYPPQIGQVSSNTFTFTPNLHPDFTVPQYWPALQVRAYFPDGSSALSAPVGPPNPKLNLNMQAFRGTSGHFYLAVQSPPPNLAFIRVFTATWDPITGYDYSHFDIDATNFVNGIVQFPIDQVTGFVKDLQAFGVNGEFGSPVGFAGYIADERNYWNINSGPYFFVDCQAHMKENLKFLLRSATATEPFSYYSSISIDPSLHLNGYAYPGLLNEPWRGYGRLGVSTNYEYYGYHQFSSKLGFSFMDELRPVNENFLWLNFSYNPANFDESGYFDSGVSVDISSVWYDPGYYNGAYLRTIGDNYYLLPSPKYQYTGLGTETPLPLVLTTSNNAWTYWGYWAYFGPDWELGAEIGIVPNGGGNPVLANNYRNCYGLLLSSLEQGSNTVVSPSSSVSVDDLLFTGFVAPQLRTVDYYFASETPYFNYQVTYPGFVMPTPPLPGAPTFAVTNVSPLLITGFGQPITLSGWAKQEITNGFAGKYAYLEQYFDKAYTMDTNGVATANQAGLISPYGEFFPTEPGPAALVTMPDIDTGQRGTGVVYVLKMQMDVNHDGVMDLSFAGPDNASQSHPMKFWVNSDWDFYGQDIDNSRVHDYDFDTIGSTRNLEDFARLWIIGLPSLSSTNGYNASLSWRNFSGSPAIKIFRPYESDGGTRYLTDTNVAFTQKSYDAFNGGYGIALGEVAANSPLYSTFAFPQNFFITQSNSHFLFEGSGVGVGELVLTVSQGTNILAQTSAWLDLRDVKDMYEQAHIINVDDSTPNTLISTYAEDKTFDSDTSEDKNIILFVHGWRIGQFDYYNFSEHMFKRLYWQGFNGRFASVRWPTLSKDDFKLPLLDLFTYNKSEFRAFQSGRGLSDYLTHLRQRFPDYKINVASHSMGGIAMMQALKLQLASGQTNIDNYVLMQTAVPAHCYDSGLANYAPFVSRESFYPTPDTYRAYPGAISAAIRGRIVNFINTNDFALATGNLPVFGDVNWEANEISYKPDSGFGYTSDGTNAYKNAVLVTDTRQAMSFVARPRSKAVGALPGVGGVVRGGDVDLTGLSNFLGDRSEHSAQFNRNIQPLDGFYAALLAELLQQP